MAKESIQFQFPEVMPLRMAALYADISEQRLRILVREGKIPATQNEKGQWLITKADIDAYKSTAKQRIGKGSPRKEGKSWVIKVKTADLDAVKAALEPFGIVLEPRYDYEKMRMYRERRHAAKAAAKTAPADEI